MVWPLLIAAVVAAAFYGLELRRWVWQATDTIRFQSDVRNGFRQGAAVVDIAEARAADLKRPVHWEDFFYAYRDTYSRAVPDNDNGRGHALDYAPGRLLVMSLWAWHERKQTPPIDDWENDYALTAPVLHLNTVMGAATALGMIALVRHWRRARAGRSVWPAWGEPWAEVPAVLAGLAVWFNPALLMNAHVWPQWDGWLLPFFVWALVAASKEKWLLAGLVGVLGAAFKGQILMVLPLLVLWLIFWGRPLGAVRVLIGGLLAMTLIGLPWLLFAPAAQLWMIETLLLAVGCHLLIGLRRRFDWVASLILLLTVGWVCPMAYRTGGEWVWGLAAGLILLIAVLPRWTGRRWYLPLLMTQFAASVYFAALTLGGQFSWFYLSYARPQGQYPAMFIGSNNLPRLLQTDYGWGLRSIVTLPGLDPVPMRTFLISLFVIALVLSSIGAAMHAARRSPRILIAFATPWVWLYTVLPQMHERYLLWGAVMMSAAFGLSAGLAGLAVVVMALAVASMSGATFDRDPGLWPAWQAVLRGMDGSVWALLLLAAICLYICLAPDRRPAGVRGPLLPQEK